MLNLDTHILIHAWSDELTEGERKILSSDQWSISGVVLWEIFKLRQLGRIKIEATDFELRQILATLHIWPVDLAVFIALAKLDFKNDPVDEIIAATSIAYNIPLLTRDKKIKKSKVVPLAALR